MITGESWPHNIFVQLLFEGGILLGFYPILLLLKKIVSIINQNYIKNQYVLMIFLLIMIIPRFLFSNDIWLIPYVWLFFGYSLNDFNNKEKKYKLQNDRRYKNESIN